MEISVSCTPSLLDHQFDSEIPQIPHQTRNIYLAAYIKITWSLTSLSTAKNFTADVSAI